MKKRDTSVADAYYTASWDVDPTKTNPKDLIGRKKCPLSLVPPVSLIYQAEAMRCGAEKYGAYNWRTKKVKATIYVDAALRHIMAYLDGENIALDSARPHIGHALACLGILADATEGGFLEDDRPVKGAAAKVLDRFDHSNETGLP
jgi:hypothetical protein